MPGAPPNELDPADRARFRQGDITALSTIFRLYGPRVYRLTVRMMGNRADAEDVAQEIFVRAFEQAHKFNGRCGLFTWLYRLAVRHCLNKIKQRTRSQAREQTGLVELPEAQETRASSPLQRLSIEERVRLLDEAMQTLPPHHRACLVLREVEGLSYAQIAELLEIPIGTVMSRLARARRSVRDRLRTPDESRAALGNNADGSVVQRIGGTNTR